MIRSEVSAPNKPIMRATPHPGHASHLRRLSDALRTSAAVICLTLGHPCAGYQGLPLIGSIIAFVMSPITNWLEHHGVNRGIGSLYRALLLLLPCSVGVVCILSPILLVRSWKSLEPFARAASGCGGDLNEMISNAKTQNNTPLKEYLDDNLSSLVTVASK